MVVACVEAVRQRLPNPVKCGTDSVQIIALWKRLGCPDPAEFAEDFALVARAARDCPHPLFARDIRAEGWAQGTDRSGSIKTLAVQESWGDRLTAAQAWAGTLAPPVDRDDPALIARCDALFLTLDELARMVTDPRRHQPRHDRHHDRRRAERAVTILRQCGDWDAWVDDRDAFRVSAMRYLASHPHTPPMAAQAAK